MLDTTLSIRDAVLLLLYAEPQGSTDHKLADDLEKRPNNLRVILRDMHAERMIEFKKPGDTARISPQRDQAG